MSNTDRDTVSAQQDLQLIGPDGITVPVTCFWHYSRQDPYAIRISLDVGTTVPVEWALSRELLAAGLHGPAGIGDVRAWPAAPPKGTAAGTARKTLMIEFRPTDGYACFEVGAAEIEAFLARTYELVPHGRETAFLDLDAELKKLLRQA